MKRLFSYLILLIFGAMGSMAQSTDTLFPYPTLPTDEGTLTERCNYLVYNFWNRCNIKQSFSSLDRLNEAFGVWASFMPYASADTVHLSIDRYIKSVEKESAKNMGAVGRMAQNWFYCDTAAYLSEELYLPFCRAVVQCKKVPAAERASYQAQLKRIESSSIGSRVPDITLTLADGSTMPFNEVLASRIVLFFNSPDCIDCSLMRARLSADYNVNQLIDQGLIKVVSIFPAASDDQWRQAAATYPTNWIVAAVADAEDYFDLTGEPQLYWLDGRHKVIGKDIDIDGLLYLIRQINMR